MVREAWAGCTVARGAVCEVRWRLARTCHAGSDHLLVAVGRAELAQCVVSALNGYTPRRRNWLSQGSFKWC